MKLDYFLAENGSYVYYFCVTFLVTFVLAILFDKFCHAVDPNNYKEEVSEEHVVRIIIQIFLALLVISIMNILIYSIVDSIPYPFHGYGGFNSLQLTNYQKSKGLILVILFLYHSKLNDRLQYISNLSWVK